jgi:RNA polymerase sigma-70 factor (ECF subfamily)
MMADTIASWRFGSWLFGGRGSDSADRAVPRAAAKAHIAEAGVGPDQYMVDQLRAGGEAALRELWDQYHERLATFALRYVAARDSAADVVQDVFISLWERREQLEIRGSLAGYLYGMVRHTALDLRKHDAIVQRHVERMTAEYTAAPIVARNLGVDVLDVELLQRTLRAVLATLPPRTREIFLMSREDGLAPAEIAATLGIAPQVVYNQLSRALKALHAAVNPAP